MNLAPKVVSPESVLTAAMMVAELIVGHLTRSMALTADGWHMPTHAGALGPQAPPRCEANRC